MFVVRGLPNNVGRVEHISSLLQSGSPNQQLTNSQVNER